MFEVRMGNTGYGFFLSMYCILYQCILYLCIHDPPMYSLCMVVFHPGRQNSNIYQYSWALEFPYAYACSMNGPGNFLMIHICTLYLWQYFILVAKLLRRRNSNIYKYGWDLEFPYSYVCSTNGPRNFLFTQKVRLTIYIWIPL